MDHAVKAFVEGKENEKVEKIMRPKIVTVDKRIKLSEALRIMRDEDVRILVVTDNGKPVGVITDQKILSILAPEQVK